MVNNNNEESEIDYKVLFAYLVNSKLIILLFFILSLMSSIYVIKNSIPEYQAKTVVEIVETQQRRGGNFDLQGNLPTSIANLLIPSFSGNAQNSLSARILGRSFLFNFINDPFIKTKVYKACSRSINPPSILSVKGILDSLNIYKFPQVSETHLDDHVLNCLKNSISIQKFMYKQASTSATEIKVLHSDPEFASFLANSIVKHLFDDLRLEELDRSNKTKEFLMETLSVAQKDVQDSLMRLKQFLIINSSIFKVDAGQDFGNVDLMNISPKSTTEIFDLSRSIENREKLSASANFLEEVIKNKNYAQFLNQEAFSQNVKLSVTFQKDILSILNEKINLENSKKIDILLEKELSRVSELIKANEKNIKIKESRAKESLQYADELKVLQSELFSKRTYLAGLSQSIQAKNLEDGLAKIEKNKIFSIATPPLFPVKPNVSLVLIYNFIIFISIGIFVSIIYRVSSDRIFVTDQLQNLFKSRCTLQINKFLRQKSLISGRLPILSIQQLKLFLGSKKKGKIVCYVNVEAKPHNVFLEDHISLLAANIKARDGKRVMIISSFLNKELHLKFSEDSDFVAQFSSEAEKEFSKKKISYKNVSRDNLLEYLDSQSFSSFDEVIIAIDDETSIEDKFMIINKCDNYILLGRKGKVTKSDIEVFLNSDYITNSEKCCGFILLS